MRGLGLTLFCREGKGEEGGDEEKVGALGTFFFFFWEGGIVFWAFGVERKISLGSLHLGVVFMDE